MTRAEALKKFLDNHQEEKEEIRKKFLEGIGEKSDQIIDTIFQAFDDLGEVSENQQKEDCVHFLFGLQRCDLLKNRAIIRLDVMGPAWYMDEDRLTTQLDLTFLFCEYFEWKEKLLLEIRSFMGKVNRYDVEILVQDEIINSNQLIVQFLRFAFRNLEEQECFSRIGKMPYWIIRWGEYRNYSEIVLRVNREEGKEAVWLEQLERSGEDADAMVAEYWYKTDIHEGDCEKKRMYFTTFEECSLSKINFGKAGLMGARFIRCRLEGCNFTEANLRQADFEDCQFEDNVFKGAELFQATFSEQGFPRENFTENQLKEMFLVRMELQNEAED